MNELFLRTSWTALPSPNELKFVLDADTFGFRKPTIFPTPDPTQDLVAGTIHPYYSPSFFYYYEARVEWKQYLSRDSFTDSTQCWYSLQYGLGSDNNFNTYNHVRGQLYWDIKPWLTVGADAGLLYSTVYHAETIGAFLILRCPP